ncbi:sugar phosphate isomerase/epimerase [Saccharopolyspora sp. 6V]|uniref:sugar phosphate isomerase/epimerase family protein n=1 Tax=Saccharopolyspora sp. 6V TaxID=2877239 RepID=UPI001CD4D5DB|nr:sugar phosphate isomerase/epimerase family protein [Saccharopolyspora sp. 6V]MCA1191927.1 sugar phosphate isomerase/epimerase [Saccharopolyspora sp. 6V]
MQDDPRPRLAGIGDEAAADLTGQLAAVRRLGWRSIELRTVDGVPLADLDEPDRRRTARQLRAAELDVVCLASRIGNWARPITAPFEDDLRELDVLAEQCRELGSRYVRIMSYPNDGLPEPEWGARARERVAKLAERAAELDVVLLHENCAGWAATDADRALRLLAEVPSLRLLFDTGNGVEHGYHAPDLLRPLIGHVAHVHVKDATGSPGAVMYVPPGEGGSRVADCLRLLLNSGYEGAYSLEPHLVARPHDGVRADETAADRFVDAGRALERLLGRLRAPYTAAAAPGRA